jgi:hypothetical protein
MRVAPSFNCHASSCRQELAGYCNVRRYESLRCVGEEEPKRTARVGAVEALSAERADRKQTSGACTSPVPWQIAVRLCSRCMDFAMPADVSTTWSPAAPEH